MNKLVNVRFALPPLTLALLLGAASGESSDNPTLVGSLTDSGAGSLRQAIADAKAGDTLKLTVAGTLTLASPIITDKNLTIVADGVALDAAGAGRVLEVPAGVTVTVKGGTLQGGVGKVISAALPGQSSTLTTYGGNVLNWGNLTLDGVTLRGGVANAGGAVASLTGATLTVQGDTLIEGNRADSPSNKLDGQGGYGGGIFALGSSVNLLGGQVKGNAAFDCGGGVNVRGDAAHLSTLVFSGGSVTGNTANGGGGGLCLTFSKTRLSGGSVTGNTARLWGGGIYSGSDLDFSAGSIQGNTGAAAGGLHADNGATFKLSGGEIRGNKAVGATNWNGQGANITALGGGLLVTGKAKVTLSGTAITENTPDDVAQ